MKFIVRRTSQHRFYDEDYPESVKPPCAGAVREDGYWTVEIATLADLFALASDTGVDLIVKAQGTDDDVEDVPGLPEVEIYDDYRE